MATLIDPENIVTLDEEDEVVNLEPTETEQTEESTETTPTETEATETTPEADEVPEKYQGKTAAEVIRMHQEAEKRLGKQSGEVGELRSIVDDFIRGQVATATKTEASQNTDEEVDFFDDPKAAVNAAIGNHPSVKAAEATTLSQTKQQAVLELQAAHPDMKEVHQSAAFGEWVTKSKYRQRLFTRADTQFDLEAADELLTAYKERQQLNTDIVETEVKARKTVAKQAATGRARGSAEPKSRKIYRRADIIKLMQEDPIRYEAMQPEIMAAYREKRVK